MKKGISLLLVIVIFASILTGCKSKEEKVADLLKIGNQCLLDKDYEKALLTFENVLKFDNENTDAYIGLAKARYGQEGARTVLDGLWAELNKADDERKAQILLGLSYLYVEIADDLAAKNNHEESIVYLEEGIKELPKGNGDILDDKLKEQYLVVAEEAVLSGENDKALDYFRRLQELTPSWARGITGAAETLVKMGKYDEALAELEKGNGFVGEKELDDLHIEIQMSAIRAFIDDKYEQNKDDEIFCADVLIENFTDAHQKEIQSIANDYSAKMGTTKIVSSPIYKLTFDNGAFGGANLPTNIASSVTLSEENSYPGCPIVSGNGIKEYDGQTVRLYGIFAPNDDLGGALMPEYGDNVFLMDNGDLYYYFDSSTSGYFFVIIYAELI